MRTHEQRYGAGARRLAWTAVFIPALLIHGLTLAGCGSEPPPEPKAPMTTGTATGVTSNTAKTAVKADAGPNTAPVNIDDRIVKMCNLPESRFDFDSSNIALPAKDVLQKIADCFLTGPGKGKNIMLIGHADPRGETEYNFALGQKRAGAVGEYLVKAGVEQGRVNSTSRGELEAIGSDAESWARDRRVEILLDEP